MGLLGLGLLGGCLWIPLGQLLILPGKCLAWLYYLRRAGLFFI